MNTTTPHPPQGSPSNHTPRPSSASSPGVGRCRRRIVFGTAFFAAVALLVAACGADDGPLEAESSRRTIEDETTTTTALVAEVEGDGTTVATETTEAEPVSDPEWPEIQFELEPLVEGNNPLATAVRPGDDDLWLIEREGRVRVVERRVSLDDRSEAYRPASGVVLDLTDRVGTAGEGGLLGFDFSADGRFLYLSYTDRDGNSVIAEYELDGLTVTPGSERVLLRVEQPFANHNGGQITLGPDGFLYVALGDGGAGGDPLGSGQDTSTLLGSMLRIDPLGGTEAAPYRVPADNPFVDRPSARPEIWLYGVRNPWRFSFDAQTGDLWIGDVGQNEIEEVTVLPVDGQGLAGRGANLGWNILEGNAFFTDGAEPEDHVAPITVYDHANGRCSVTGGYVYRGGHVDALQGVYVYGDFCSGEIFGLQRLADGRVVEAPINVGEDVGQIVSFGQGPDGEIHVIENNGRISRLQAGEGARDVELYGPDEEIPGDRFGE